MTGAAANQPEISGYDLYLSAMSARSGGGVTYLNRILPHFPSENGDRLFILSTNRFEAAGNPAVRHVALPAWTDNPILRRLLCPIWFRLFFRRRRCDGIYFAGGSIDIPVPRGARTIVAFRNMLPFSPDEIARYPLGYLRLRNIILRRLMSRAFRIADLVIFLSRHARDVIDTVVPDRRGASVVIPHGVVRKDGEAGPERPARLPEPYVAYVSMIDAYKAQIETVRAWALMRQSRPGPEKLVIVGPSRAPFYEKRLRALVAELGMTQSVILYGNAAGKELDAIYRHALFHVYASSCENCPNILLEIFAAGAPVICSSYQPMPEVGGEGLDYYDPYDIPAAASLMARTLDDAGRRERGAAYSRERAQLFSWERSARQTWASIRECLDWRQGHGH